MKDELLVNHLQKIRCPSTLNLCIHFVNFKLYTCHLNIVPTTVLLADGDMGQNLVHYKKVLCTRPQSIKHISGDCMSVRECGELLPY